VPLEIVSALGPGDGGAGWRETGVAAGEPAGEGEVLSDRVVLVNGDVLTGFVEGIDGGGLRLSPEAGAALTIGLERVAEVWLVNPLRDEPIEDHRVTLVDGSRLAGRGLRVASGSLLGETEGRLTLDARLPGAGWRAVTVPMRSVGRIDLSGYRLVPLGALSAERVVGGEVFGVAWPAESTGQGWAVHAPTTVVWELPGEARRVKLRARLSAEGLSGAAASLADCRVRWSAATDAALTRLGAPRLSGGGGEDRPHTLTAELPEGATRLAVEVEAEANGPIADRVVLDGPGVLVVRSAESRSAY